MGLEPKKCPQPLGRDEGLVERQLLAQLWVPVAHARVEGTGGGEGAVPPCCGTGLGSVWVETRFFIDLDYMRRTEMSTFAK